MAKKNKREKQKKDRAQQEEKPLLNLGGLRAIVPSKDGSSLTLGDPAVTLEVPVPRKKIEVGDYVAGKGVFLGVWQPKQPGGFFRKEKILGTFNLYAAPYDLGINGKGNGARLLLSFNDVSCNPVQRKRLCGHSLALYFKEAGLYSHIKHNYYRGQWFIPTKEILQGFMHPNFNKISGLERLGLGRYYWSSTPHEGASDFFYAINLMDGMQSWGDRSKHKFAVRLVRAEPVSPP